MKKILIIIGIVLLIILIYFALPQNNAYKSYAYINGQKFNIEIAKTDAEKEIGLSKYNKISDDFGMYFPFGSSNYYSFWMKDMKFPIDIIYLNKNEVVQIFKNAPIPNNREDELEIYRNQNPADSVLEINANLSNKYSIKIGDIININYK